MRGVAAFLLVAVALPAAGCLEGGDLAVPWRASLSGPALAIAPWSDGSFWTYHATFKSGRSIDVALVVDQVRPDGYRLGTNLSAGFFGLPFNGTVTRGHLNPMLGDEEWRLYEFPLQSGKSWEYTLMGYPVRTTVSAGTLGAPGVDDHGGFVLESTSYGKTFARYTYSPVTGWFTSLTLFEPTDGSTVLDVRLTGHGDRYGEDYFVQVPVRRVVHDYPSLDRADELRLPAGRLTALLTLRGTVGEFRATLLSPDGRALLEGAVHGQGAALERAAFDGRAGRYTLDHLGLGQGKLHLDISAVVRSNGGDAPPADGPGEAVDLGGLLAHAAPPRPARLVS